MQLILSYRYSDEDEKWPKYYDILKEEYPESKEYKTLEKIDIKMKDFHEKIRPSEEKIKK